MLEQSIFIFYTHYNSFLLNLYLSCLLRLHLALTDIGYTKGWVLKHFRFNNEMLPDFWVAVVMLSFFPMLIGKKN